MRGQNILKSHPLTLNFLTDNIKPIILVFPNEILLKKSPEIQPNYKTDNENAEKASIINFFTK